MDDQRLFTFLIRVLDSPTATRNLIMIMLAVWGITSGFSAESLENLRTMLP